MAEQEEFDEGLELIGAKTLRTSLSIKSEDLVASELASAVLSEPLAKIRHVCEAVMFLDDTEKGQAGITDTDERGGLNIDKILWPVQFQVSDSDNFMFPLRFYL